MIDYDPLTGILTWKERSSTLFCDGTYPAARYAAVWNGKFAGTPALNTPLEHGHRYGSIWERKVYAHRVIWKLVYGTEPDEIDHINGDPSDNRLVNLRSVSHAENSRNMKQPRNNTSGSVGVRWNDECGKWHAEIGSRENREYLGLFPTFEAAVAARKAAEARLGFHPNHGRKMKEMLNGTSRAA